MLAMSPQAVADDAQTKAQIDCENAAYAQYKKDIDAMYTKIGTRPTTVQEVMADRRLTEAYCLKDAACAVKGGAKPELLGRNFEKCLDGEAQERQRQLDDFMRDVE